MSGPPPHLKLEREGVWEKWQTQYWMVFSVNPEEHILGKVTDIRQNASPVKKKNQKRGGEG